MLDNIPTYVLAGPLGAGKTSIARHWLAQRPAQERWAVLVNEFGDIGLDAGLIGTSKEGVTVTEVAGGCVCCTNGAPFTVGLTRLLRQAQPDRLLIELSGLSHPRPLLRQLASAPWAGVLSVQAFVVVLDGIALSQARPVPETVREAMADPCLLVINKAEALDQAERLRIEAMLKRQAVWISQGALNWEVLHTAHQEAVQGRLRAITSNLALPMSWSIGWQAAPEQVIDASAVEVLLMRWPWIRAKMIIHSANGWQSANLLPGSPMAWRTSEWRKDSRLELIFEQPQDKQQLDIEWMACLRTT